MITHGMSSRDRRALLIGAACIAALVVTLRGLPAWYGWRAEARSEAVEVMSRAARTQAVLRAFPETFDTLQARTGRVVDLAPALLIGDTPEEAALILRVAVTYPARAASVRLDQVETRIIAADSQPLPRLFLDARGTGDVRGLAALLRGLEQGPTMIAVRRLVVAPHNVHTPADQVELLSIEFTVESLALAGKRGEMP